MSEPVGNIGDFQRMLGVATYDQQAEAPAESEIVSDQPETPAEAEAKPVDAEQREAIAQQHWLPPGSGVELHGEYREEVDVSAQVLARDRAVGRQLFQPSGEKARRDRALIEMLHPEDDRPGRGRRERS